MFSSRIISFFLFLCLSILSSFGLDLGLNPCFNVPFGPTGASGQGYYTLGGGGSLNADFTFPGVDLLFLRTQAGFDYLSVSDQSLPPAVSIISLGAGIGLGLSLSQEMMIKLSLSGGAGMFLVPEFLSDSNPDNDFFLYPFARAELSADIRINPSLSLLIGANYTYYITQPVVYHGLGAFLGVAFHLGEEAAQVKIRELKLLPIFPVFYSAYDEQSLGAVVIANEEAREIQDVRVSFFIKEYMDSPMQMPVIKEIRAGEEKSVPLFALFNDKLMKITEGTKLSAEVKVEYSFRRQAKNVVTSGTLVVYDRNAMIWDDDRKAAAFITAKSPAVLLLSKNASGLVRSHGLKAVNQNFRTGVGVFEMLGLYGMKYVVDPASSYRDKAAQKTSIDYLQFPAQSLAYRSGDCDDLSILYAALLESVAVRTALITIPGHIYVAFSLDMSQQEASRIFRNTQDLIFSQEDAWVPVEITMMDRGFLAAWRTGAQQWREAKAKNQAGFYEVEKAWETYSPVGIEENQRILIPDEAELVRRYTASLDGLIQREISEQVSDLENQIAWRPNDPALLNKLGLLYARYGYADKAGAAFNRSVAGNGGWAPLVNLANLSYMQGDAKRARDLYKRALELNPENTAARVGLLLAYHELGEDGQKKAEYEKLKISDVRLAEKYAWLVSGQSGGRAGTVEGSVLWSD